MSPVVPRENWSLQPAGPWATWSQLRALSGPGIHSWVPPGSWRPGPLGEQVESWTWLWGSVSSVWSRAHWGLRHPTPHSRWPPCGHIITDGHSSLNNGLSSGWPVPRGFQGCRRGSVPTKALNTAVSMSIFKTRETGWFWSPTEPLWWAPNGIVVHRCFLEVAGGPWGHAHAQGLLHSWGLARPVCVAEPSLMQSCILFKPYIPNEPSRKQEAEGTLRVKNKLARSVCLRIISTCSVSYIHIIGLLGLQVVIDDFFKCWKEKQYRVQITYKLAFWCHENENNPGYNNPHGGGTYRDQPSMGSRSSETNVQKNKTKKEGGKINRPGLL